MRLFKLLSSLVFLGVALSLSSCFLFHRHMGWVRVQNAEVYIWADTTKKGYVWWGDSLGVLANGEGTLGILHDDGKDECLTVSALYGSFCKEDDAEVFDDGSFFIGNMDDDRFEGMGLYVKGDDVYFGNFSQGRPDGFLRWYQKGKIHYSGNWVGGSFQGQGTFYADDGSKRTGIWEDGKLVKTYYKGEWSGGVYDGMTSYGKPDGEGIMVYSDSSAYRGGWKDGEFSGEGFFCSGSDTLAGVWSHNKLNGQGFYATKNMSYVGAWVDHKPQGQGFLRSRDSSCYSGSWSKGMRSGQGVMTFANGDVYSGFWSSNAFSGQGVYTFAKNGDTYEGEWKDGLQDGYGIFKGKNFCYEGQWEEGWINGTGQMTFANKDSYVGDFVEGERFGQGCYTFANGNSYEGEFVDDKFNGIGSFKFNDGCLYQGEFHNGKIMGDGSMYIVNGDDITVITANWKGDGTLPTSASVLFPNGDLYEGALVNGRPTRNGTWTTAKDRDEGTVMNALNSANEFFKRHEREWDNIVDKASKCLEYGGRACEVVGWGLMATGVGAAAGAVLVGVGKAASTAGVCLTVTKAAVKSASVGLDVANGDMDAKEGVFEIGTTLAGVVVQIALKRIPIRKTNALKKLSPVARTVARSKISSAINLSRNKVMGKFVSHRFNGDGCLDKLMVKACSPSETFSHLGEVKAEVIKRFKDLKKVQFKEELKKFGKAAWDSLKKYGPGIAFNLIVKDAVPWDVVKKIMHDRVLDTSSADSLKVAS